MPGNYKEAQQASPKNSEMPIEELFTRHFCLSPFTFLIRKKTYCALYHSLNLKKIFGDERLAKIYRMGKSRRPHPLQDFQALLNINATDTLSAELKLMLDTGMLVLVESNPYEPLEKMQHSSLLQTPHISLLYLLVSNQCNLRCSYCSIESIERKPLSFNYSLMSNESARLGIDLFSSVLHHSVKESRIIYYGGEPLLNWNTMRDSLSYIRECESKGLFNSGRVDVSMVCNGTLMTDEIGQEMRRLSLSAGISLDGLKHHHDRMRPFREGGGSWEDSLKGYYLVKKYRGNCGISCTMGPHNYRDVEEIAEFFVTRLECRGMGFNIMKGLPPGNAMEVPVESITKQLIKAYRIFRRYGIYEDRIMRKIRSFVIEEPWLYDCAGYGGQLALCADGLVGPCHVAADDGRFCWGHIQDLNLRDTLLGGELTRHWCQRSPMTMKACFDCIGLGICGGGCAEEAFVKSGDTHGVDENFCIHCKVLLDWMFDDLAEKLKDSGDL